MEPTSADKRFLRLAYEEARRSFEQGGVAVGAALAEGEELVALGHNRRVQNGDPTAHGEMDCIRNAGRRTQYAGLTLYTTLSPCIMCAGAVVLLGIPRVVIGDAVNFAGSVEFLRSHGVEVLVVEDEDCIALTRTFIEERPELWSEDSGGRV